MIKEAQKGVRTIVERFIYNEPPLKSKWAMNYSTDVSGRQYLFTHYQHVLLVVNPRTKLITYQWWEKPTDLRGLQSAVLVLKEKKKIKEEYQWDNTIKQFVLTPNNVTPQTELN